MNRNTHPLWASLTTLALIIGAIAVFPLFAAIILAFGIVRQILK